MDYTGLFYWLVVADNARTFFGWAVVIFMFALVIEIIAKIITSIDDNYSKGDKEERKAEQKRDHQLINKFLFRTIPWTILFWFLLVFTPTKRDALLIVAGGQTLNYLTTDTTAQKLPHELSNFLVTEIKNLASEAEVEIVQNKVEKEALTTKQRIIDEAKDLTTEELLKKMQDDNIFKEIILEKLKE